MTSRKYSLRKSNISSPVSNSLPQSEVQPPKPCNEEDIREERVRYFMETWSEIKFDRKNNLFIGRNNLECLDLDIDAVRASDKKDLIETIDLESLKTSRKDQWVELPIAYKNYINKYAKEVIIFEGLLSQKWAKLKYDKEKDVFIGSIQISRRCKEKNSPSFESTEFPPMFVSHLIDASEKFKKTFENSKSGANEWHNIPPGASSKTTKQGFRVMSHGESRLFKFYFQGEKNSCVFSSLASALSYKGFNEASKILHDHTEVSLSKKDPMTFAYQLLKKELTVTLFKEQYDKDKSIYLKRSHNNPTVIQTLCEERVHPQL